MSMTEFIINGHGNTEIIEENHFLIQTVRIPKNEERFETTKNIY